MNAVNVWLIGAGGMAVDYVKVLAALGANVTVIGRGEGSARRMQEACGLSVVTGGLGSFLSNRQESLPDAAIVAVGVENLAATTIQLLQAGVKKVLLEKPGALHYSELRDLHEKAHQFNAEVVIGYNRRMYASVLAAQQMIEEDGGLRSIHFEFTEWGHVIEKLEKAPGVKEAWLLGNSTHVIDLAFYLAGAPDQWHAVHDGGLSWHPSSAIFAGAGQTTRGVVFSYQANWGAPGRWSVEALTRNRRFVFRPMESLQVVKRGSVAIEMIDIDDVNDKAYKPGLYRQVEKFLLDDRDAGLCSLDEQLAMWPVYEEIAGYSGDKAGV